MDQDNQLVHEAIKMFRSGKRKRFDVATKKTQRGSCIRNNGIDAAATCGGTSKVSGRIFESVPDEIKFLKKTKAKGQADQDMYFFRFRIDEPHWAAEDGWMIGWSGPFPRRGPPQLSATGTFSELEKWDGVESPAVESASVVNKLKELFKPK